MKVDCAPVKSGNIDSIGYCPDTKTLVVQFKNGSIYHYHDVEKSAHSEFMAADSHGKHLHDAIKGKYDHTKQ